MKQTPKDCVVQSWVSAGRSSHRWWLKDGGSVCFGFLATMKWATQFSVPFNHDGLPLHSLETTHLSTTGKNLKTKTQISSFFLEFFPWVFCHKDTFTTMPKVALIPRTEQCLWELIAKASGQHSTASSSTHLCHPLTASLRALPPAPNTSQPLAFGCMYDFPSLPWQLPFSWEPPWHPIGWPCQHPGRILTEEEGPERHLVTIFFSLSQCSLYVHVWLSALRTFFL